MGAGRRHPSFSGIGMAENGKPMHKHEYLCSATYWCDDEECVPNKEGVVEMDWECDDCQDDESEDEDQE